MCTAQLWPTAALSCKGACPRWSLNVIAGNMHFVLALNMSATKELHSLHRSSLPLARAALMIGLIVTVLTSACRAQGQGKDAVLYQHSL